MFGAESNTWLFDTALFKRNVYLPSKTRAVHVLFAHNDSKTFIGGLENLKESTWSRCM